MILLVLGAALAPHHTPALAHSPASSFPMRPQQIPGGLEGGVDWINTSGPIHLEDLRGKIVLLDFWTYCCINCHHVLPDLEFLEKKYPDELVVIGVHTAKFDAERDTENIKQKVAEYRIRHPVVNDANQVIWNRFNVQSWPTLVVINANGEYVGSAPGEGNRAVLDRVIGKLVEEHRAAGELNLQPLRFFPESEKPHDGPLLYPGKVTADAAGDRLFITDTGHNRIVVTDLQGTGQYVIGDGQAGLKDGGFDEARFNRPQGTLLHRGKLYVADVENHAIREVDLDTRTVRTIAGTGEQAYRRGGKGKAIETGLNSPWDLAPLDDDTLIIAMAGPHQLWRLELESGIVAVWAGTGREDINDGPILPREGRDADKPPGGASFAQPSGLATDGRLLWVADSEGSCVREITFQDKKPQVTTIAGTHDLPMGQSLFAFGDVDGVGNRSRLQHCLGVAHADGMLYVADSYNNKIKVIDLKSRDVRTLAGTRGGGSTNDPPQFDEPGGLAVVGDELYVADTNNHAIRVVNRKTAVTRTLALAGVKPPIRKKARPRFPRAEAINVAEQTLVPSSVVRLAVEIQVPEGFDLGTEAPMPYLVEAPDAPTALAPEAPTEGGQVEPPSARFTVDVPLAKTPASGDRLTLRLSASAFECKKGSSGFCRIRNFAWTIPIRFAAEGASRIELTSP
jgi:thiol-disulfide isomerase/thioredoxin